MNSPQALVSWIAQSRAIAPDLTFTVQAGPIVDADRIAGCGTPGRPWRLPWSPPPRSPSWGGTPSAYSSPNWTRAWPRAARPAPDTVADAIALWLGLHGLAYQRAVTAAFPWPADIAERLITSLAHLTS